MAKIGIVTLCGNHNYGNKLQNYALLKTLEKQGHDVETIWIEYNYVKSKKHIFLKKHKTFLQDIFNSKRRNIKKFNQKLKIGKSRVIYNGEFNKLRDKYDYFVVGSDQVWNPRFFDNDELFLLKDIESRKRISYAASFGLHDFPRECILRFRDGLNHFKKISVREERGKELVKEITGRDDTIVSVDPTFLLSSEEWSSILKKPKKMKGKQYILNMFIGNVSEKRKKTIYDYAKKNNLEVINIMNKKDKFYNSTVDEFLYLIKNANLVCTDSFHSCVFSIIFERPFLVFDRDDLVGNMNSRLETLLKKFQLENKFFRNNKIQKKNLITDYTKAKRIIKKETKVSLKYLNDCLVPIEEKNNSIVVDDERCTGCSACFNVCPVKAIEMKYNKEGFLYPVVNKEKCVNCGLCKNVCPLKTKENKSLEECFAGYNKDEMSLLEKSSSGSIFDIFANYFIENDGIVIGAAFDNNLRLKHIAINKKIDILKLKGSKYVQSEIGNIFQFVKENIENKKILFVGTPCQIAGLKAFLKEDYPNLFTIDLVCHGVPSTKIFEKYIKELEYNLCEKITDYNFRDKTTGWKHFSNTFYYNGNSRTIPQWDTSFMKLFLSNISLRKSCHNCNFRQNNKYSDITLGDFWGIENKYPEMFNPSGVSAIIINTKKGKETFDKIKNRIILKSVLKNDIIESNPQLVKSLELNKNRKFVFRDINKYTTSELARRYSNK